MMQIKCERGVIYPHGGSLRAVEVDGRPITANRLGGLDCTTVVQDGESEITFTFDVDEFDAVAAIVKPRRKRQISAERREAARLHMLKLNECREFPNSSPFARL